jgi:hypothetical protein
MQKIKSRSQGSLWKAAIALRLQKWGGAAFIHLPHRVDEVLKTKHSDALGKADPYSRPQKIKCRILMTNVSHSGNNHKGPAPVAGHTSVVAFQALMSTIRRPI